MAKFKEQINMATAQEIVTEALEKAGVTPTGQTPPNDKSVRGLSLLNDWIAELKNDGLDFQLSTLALADTVYLDASDISCLKTNLTLLIAEHWKLPLPNSVYARAVKLLDDVRDKYTQALMEEMEYPDGLKIINRSNIINGC